MSGIADFMIEAILVLSIITTVTVVFIWGKLGDQE